MLFEVRFDFAFHQIEGESAVLVAGDPEREHMRKVDQDGGCLLYTSDAADE